MFSLVLVNIHQPTPPLFLFSADRDERRQCLQANLLVDESYQSRVALLDLLINLNPNHVQPMSLHFMT